MQEHAEQQLAALAEQGLLRQLATVPCDRDQAPAGAVRVLNFASNDYLNLSRHPEVVAAAADAVERYGCGAGASRLMAGHLDLHDQLEAALAAMVGTEAALVFGSGFLTNLGVLTTLAGQGDVVFADRQNHASLVDGMRLSGATWHRYRHQDLDHLEHLLKKHRSGGRRIIVSDSVFSMDGEIAPLRGLRDVANRYDAVLMIDEAHAIGVMGPSGEGACRAIDVVPDVVVGTLSKALGSYGGFVGCSRTMRDLLINRARSFIYSTALPPACVGAAIKAIEVIRSAPAMGQTLLARARGFHERLSDAGLNVWPFGSQIVPVRVGQNEPAVRLAERLRQHGLIAPAIRPPTVPAGTARVRLSVTLAHTDDDLAHAGKVIAESLREVGIL